jgi:hypothetical protein
VQIKCFVWFLNVNLTVRAVVTRIVANVPTSEFKNPRSKLIESEAEKREVHICSDPGANEVTVGERGTPTVIAALEGCPPASVGERLKWTVIV